MGYFMLDSRYPVSSRHPFHGYVAEGNNLYDRDVRTEIDKRYNYEMVRGFGGASEWIEKGGPLLKGALAGLFAWGIAKSVGIESSKAIKVGVVMAVVDTSVTFARQWLLKGATQPAPGPVGPPAASALAPGGGDPHTPPDTLLPKGTPVPAV